MTPPEKRRLEKIIRLIDEAAILADGMELMLDSGGLVGCLLGTMSDELSVRVKQPAKW